MRHRKTKITLDRKAGPRRALLRNLAASVILHEKVQTTMAKAKAVKPIVEKMITKGKANSLASRRELLRYFPTEHPAKKILEVLSPRYKDRKGGYTRIVRVGARPGDAAEVVQIELV